MNDSKTIDLYDLDLPEIEALLTSWGEPSYRARQIWVWLYRHLVTSFDEMTTLPKALRQRLADEVSLYVPRVLERQESMTGETRKDLLELKDGERVEVVLMRYLDRRSACLSTQVGCAMGCEFCATGQMGFVRDLTSGEIVTQLLHLERELAAQEQHLSNVVLMGMGEPFLNYDNTLDAIRRIIHSEGLCFGQRRLTVSTVGIVPGIRRFAKEDLQVNLAISLHAATDELRNRLMPVNRRYPLDPLFSAVREYITRTNRQVTFEWVLIHGINDMPEQAEILAARIKGMLAHVNLIPLNPTEDFEGQPATPDRIEAFTEVLERHHFSYSVRLRRGIDIRAGCGQLRKRAAQS
ncbi:MAG: 23S rRNA (adenine(2503)-C(2))-methyltransferase RlmN [Anaerolineae bacterium]